MSDDFPWSWAFHTAWAAARATGFRHRVYKDPAWGWLAVPSDRRLQRWSRYE